MNVVMNESYLYFYPFSAVLITITAHHCSGKERSGEVHTGYANHPVTDTPLASSNATINPVSPRPRSYKRPGPHQGTYITNSMHRREKTLKSGKALCLDVYDCHYAAELERRVAVDV